MTELFFYSFAILTVLGTVACVTLRNPVHAVLALAFAFVSQAGLYLLLSAQFVAIIQVILYTGAIVVLFLFTIMLLNLQNITKEKTTNSQVLAYGLSLVFFVIASFAVSQTQFPAVAATMSFPSEFNDIQNLGQLLMGHYALVFEIISALLVAALMAVAILSKKMEKAK
jgi:NADH-quinone oxidoreductase subunit J